MNYIYKFHTVTWVKQNDQSSRESLTQANAKRGDVVSICITLSLRVSMLHIHVNAAHWMASNASLFCIQTIRKSDANQFSCHVEFACISFHHAPFYTNSSERATYIQMPQIQITLETQKTGLVISKWYVFFFLLKCYFLVNVFSVREMLLLETRVTKWCKSWLCAHSTRSSFISVWCVWAGVWKIVLQQVHSLPIELKIDLEQFCERQFLYWTFGRKALKVLKNDGKMLHTCLFSTKTLALAIVNLEYPEVAEYTTGLCVSKSWNGKH